MLPYGALLRRPAAFVNVIHFGVHDGPADQRTIRMIDRVATLHWSRSLASVRRIAHQAVRPVGSVRGEALLAIAKSGRPQSMRFPIRAFAVGDQLCIFGLPYEPFAEYHHFVERVSPFERTMVFGYTNGLHCYVGTEKDYLLNERGGYETSPWGAALMFESRLPLMGQVGNDVLFIPVVHGTHLGHQTGLVRWVKDGTQYRPEFAVLQRYLDLYEKHCGPPSVICLVVWKPQFGSHALFRGAQVKTREPIVVTQLDPATGGMSPLTAPMFGKPDSEVFWKSMIDGVRKIVRGRGWDERQLMLSQGFDSRPLQEAVDFFHKIAPGMRWTVFSHWSGDPGPKDGKLIVSPT